LHKIKITNIGKNVYYRAKIHKVNYQHGPDLKIYAPY